MNKLLYILPLILLTSCVEDMIAPLDVANKDGKIAISFNLSIPGSVDTKAMGETAVLNNLFLFNFNNEKKYLGHTSATNSNNRWTANIDANTKYIHFVANLPERLQNETFSSGSTEWDVMQSFVMELSAKEDVYWTRLEKVPGVMEVFLTRSFAKISVVQASNANFELDSYVLSDIPSKGYIAAVDVATPDSGMFGSITDGLLNYNPAVPSGDNYICSTNNWGAYKAEKGSNFYLYEMPGSNAAYIIAKCKYPNDSGKYYYYKIDLRDDKDSHFTVKRNEQYTIYLNYATGPGYETVEDAVNGDFGRMSTTASNKDHTFITNGKASLSVSYTEIVLSDSEHYEENKLYYDFKYDGVNSANGDQGQNGEGVGDYVSIGSINTSVISISTPKKISSPDGWYANIAWSEGEEAKKIEEASLSINAYLADGSYLSRPVRFITMPKQMLTPSSTSVEAIKGTLFDLNITIPSGLENYTSMFPIDFFIEPEANTVTPSEAMRTETGKSVTGSGNPAYKFVKSLTLSEYLALEESAAGTKTFSCKLKTTADQSGTTIHVASKHFKTKSCSLTATAPANGFRNLLFSQVSGYPNEKEADGNYKQEMVYFSFNTVGITKGSLVTVTLSRGLTPYLEGPYADILGDNNMTYTLTGKEKEGFYLKIDSRESDFKVVLQCGSIICEKEYILPGEDDKYTNLELYQSLDNGIESKDISVGINTISYLLDPVYGQQYSYYNPIIGEAIGIVFSFDVIEIEPIKLFFDGLVPAQNEARLTIDKDGTYSYIPISVGKQEIKLAPISPAGKLYATIVDEQQERSILSNRRININLAMNDQNSQQSLYYGIANQNNFKGIYPFIEVKLFSMDYRLYYYNENHVPNRISQVGSISEMSNDVEVSGYYYHFWNSYYGERSMYQYYPENNPCKTNILTIDLVEDFSANSIFFKNPYILGQDSAGITFTAFSFADNNFYHERYCSIPFNYLANNRSEPILVTPAFLYSYDVGKKHRYIESDNFFREIFPDAE